MLAKVKQLCETVGFGLSKFALQKYGGVTDASKIGFAKLTMVFDKLTDLANGIERLRTASGKLGEGSYATICRELNVASDALDDIPDRDGLCALLKRVEAEAAAAMRGATQHHVNGSIEEFCAASCFKRLGGCGRRPRGLAQKVRRRDRARDRWQGDAGATEEPDGIGCSHTQGRAQQIGRVVECPVPILRVRSIAVSAAGLDQIPSSIYTA